MSKMVIWMSDAAAILREVYGANARKKISRDFGVAMRTAKAWLDGLFPESRTEELAAVVRADLARRQMKYTAILQQIETAGADNEQARIGASGDKSRSDPDRGATRPGVRETGRHRRSRAA